MLLLLSAWRGASHSCDTPGDRRKSVISSVKQSVNIIFNW